MPEPIVLEQPEERARQEWALLRTDDDRLILSVRCGGVAPYTITMVLTPEERREYELSGRGYIESLVDRVAFHHAQFAHRHLDNPY